MEEKSPIATYTYEETIPNPKTISNLTDDYREKSILAYKQWRLVPLYKKNLRGKTMGWCVSFNIEKQNLVIIHGFIDGKTKMQTEEIKVILNQSKRDIHQQSVLEAKARFLNKQRSGYSPYSNQPVITPDTFDKPMLANVWVPDKMKLDYPVYLQPKLDGFRCLAKLVNGKMKYMSRGGREFPHLNGEFDQEIVPFIQCFPYTIQLDGEIYCHGYTFSELSSMFKNERTKHPDIKKLTYNIFDFSTHDAEIPFERRYDIMADALDKYKEKGLDTTRFCIVLTSQANTHEDIMNAHQYFVSEGYEGTMIKKISGNKPSQALYVHGRTNNILKHKDFIDSEGIVVGVKNAKGTEEGVGLLVVRIKHKNANGKDVESDITMRPTGSFERRQEWLKHPETIIGSTVVYKYRETTEYGIPRFPVVKGERDFELKE